MKCNKTKYNTIQRNTISSSRCRQIWVEDAAYIVFYWRTQYASIKSRPTILSWRFKLATQSVRRRAAGGLFQNTERSILLYQYHKWQSSTSLQQLCHKLTLRRKNAGTTISKVVWWCCPAICLCKGTRGQSNLTKSASRGGPFPG